MRKLILIYIILFLVGTHSFAQKGIGISGTIYDINNHTPVTNQQIFIVIDSLAYPLVQNLHHMVYSQSNGSFTFYQSNIPYSSFPLKVMVYTYDCEYKRVGYDLIFYYDNVIADSIDMYICTHENNPLSIAMKTLNPNCPTHAYLSNTGIRNWNHIHEEFLWNVNQEFIGTGNNIDVLFEEPYNDIVLTAVLKDSITGFLITDDLYSTFTVNFPQSYFHILAGNVFSGSMPINSGTAILLRNYNSVFEFVDTISFDTLGYYYFNEIPQCNYTVKIIDAVQTTTLPIIPTYLGDKLHWEQCNHICLQQNEYQQNINLIMAQSLSGPGYIFGYITPQPDDSYDIILYNDMMEPVKATVTNDDGIFEFGNLPLGTYHIYTDRYGAYSMSNTVTLTSDNPNAVVYLQQATGIENLNVENVSIYPNPASDKIFIDAEDILTVKIYDQQGRIINESFYYNSGLDIQSLNPGLYFLRAITKDGELINSKFLKY